MTRCSSSELPGAEAARQKIVRFIEEHIGTGGAEGEYYRSALKDLKLRWLLFIGSRPVGGDPGVQPVISEL